MSTTCFLRVPPARLIPAILLLFLNVACQRPGRIATEAPLTPQQRDAVRIDLPIFDRAGGRATWNDMLSAAADHDVVIIGEQHDDAVGHAVQCAFVEDAVGRWPDTALSMEQLDRRRQSDVDDYVAGIIDRDEFMTEIASTKFRSVARAFLDGDIDRATFQRRIFAVGWPDWVHNYQPIIDVAREHDMAVIASNTPWRHYASLANHEGFERLDALTPAQRALVEVPEIIPSGPYRKRFNDVMSPPSDDKEAGVHGSANAKALDGAFRAQCVMDATMADSIAKALASRPGRVIHLVGQFHSDFDGGIVLQLRHLRPQARIMTISMRSVPSQSVREEDRNRADFVVYTGATK